MTNNDKTEFYHVITRMYEHWGLSAMNGALFGWWTALEDLSLSRVLAAVNRAMGEDMQFPTVMQIREYAEGGE